MYVAGILVSDWLITSHVTLIVSSDWLRIYYPPRFHNISLPQVYSNNQRELVPPVMMIDFPEVNTYEVRAHIYQGMLQESWSLIG